MKKIKEFLSLNVKDSNKIDNTSKQLILRDLDNTNFNSISDVLSFINKKYPELDNIINYDQLLKVIIPKENKITRNKDLVKYTLKVIIWWIMFVFCIFCFVVLEQFVRNQLGWG